MRKKKDLFILMGSISVVLLVLFASLPGCAPAPKVDSYQEYVSRLPAGCEPVPRECFEQAQEEGELNIYDWAEWWPEEIYEGFSQEFGIKITRDNFSDYDEVVTKFKLMPEIPYDFLYLDTRAVIQLNELGVLKEINNDWVPNVNSYLLEQFRDVGLKNSKPFDVSATAYSYNSDYVDDPRLPSWAVLLEPDEKYKGRITLTNNMWEVIPAALKYLGYSSNSDDEGQLMEVRDLLLELKPYIMAFDSWPVRLMVEEEAYIAQQWSGDAYFLHQELESIQAALPTEGTQLLIDAVGIPIGNAHPAVAHLWINYLYRPEVNAQVIETIGYTPVHSAVPGLLSEEMKAWPGVVLTEEYLANCTFLGPEAFTEQGVELRSAIWQELKQ